MPEPAHPLPAEVLAALRRGSLIDAIKALRSTNGFGLQQARQALDQYLREQTTVATRKGAKDPVPPSSPQTSSSYESLAGSDGLSPGEVPRSSAALVWWIVAAAVLAVVYFSRDTGQV